MADPLSAIIEASPPERPATGFVFTAGPLWHPDGVYDFVDVRARVPGPPHPWYGKR